MTSLLRRQRPLLAGLVALSLGACARSALDEELPEEPGPLPVVAEPPCGRFELRGELAIDKGSGLQWTRFVRLAFASHEEASAQCASLGMRLPVRAELQALLEPGRRACDLPCGFSGHGFQHAPAAGRILADLMTGHDPQFDLSPFASDRFTRTDIAGEHNVV